MIEQPIGHISSGTKIFKEDSDIIDILRAINNKDTLIQYLLSYSPFERYAGFEVMDSGSTGVSASMLWDSQNDYWLFISSSGQSSKFVGTTAGPSGAEVSLTSGTFPIGTASNTIGNSLLTYTGTIP